MRERGTEPEKPTTLTLVIVALLLFIVSAGVIAWCWQYDSSSRNPGTVGDSFGILTSFVAMMASVGVYATYRKEAMQVELLLQDRAASRLAGQRTELVEAYNLMFEAKRMIVELQRADAELQHFANAQHHGGHLPATIYTIPTVRALYNVQNTWLLQSLNVVAANPELISSLRNQVQVLLATLSPDEIMSMKYIINPDLSFVALIDLSTHHDKLQEHIADSVDEDNFEEWADFQSRVDAAKPPVASLLSPR